MDLDMLMCSFREMLIIFLRPVLVLSWVDLDMPSAGSAVSTMALKSMGSTTTLAFSSSRSLLHFGMGERRCLCSAQHNIQFQMPHCECILHSVMQRCCFSPILVPEATIRCLAPSNSLQLFQTPLASVLQALFAENRLFKFHATFSQGLLGGAT